MSYWSYVVLSRKLLVMLISSPESTNETAEGAIRSDMLAKLVD
jgi:hypothetical protein